MPDALITQITAEAERAAPSCVANVRRASVRPLRVGLLNLMPDKPTTEAQFSRLLAAAPLEVEVSLLRLNSHIPRGTSAEHMSAFYRPWDEMRHDRLDGFIVTGAPVETLEFDQVAYWDELRRIFDWAERHVHSCMTICWGAQAALQHFHGVDKHVLPAKRFGVYSHTLTNPMSTYLRGFSDEVEIPVSRWTEVRREDLQKIAALEVLMDSDEAGPCLVADLERRALHMFNHLEYDARTLADEFDRDRTANPAAAPPARYFPDNDPARPPKNRWRSHAHLLFNNWLDEIHRTAPLEQGAI